MSIIAREDASLDIFKLFLTVLGRANISLIIEGNVVL